VNTPQKPANIDKLHNMKYFTTELSHSPSFVRQYKFNCPQDLIHSNANHKFYNYFFNYSPALDPFSDKYYLNNPKVENYKVVRKPSPTFNNGVNFSQDNYMK